MPGIPISGLPAAPGRIPTAPGVGESGPAAGEVSFGDFLQQALAQVEAAQREASRQGLLLASGQADDLARVMIASEKATLALQLTIAVRNKVLEAYQEILRMPL